MNASERSVDPIPYSSSMTFTREEQRTPTAARRTRFAHATRVTLALAVIAVTAGAVAGACSTNNAADSQDKVGTASTITTTATAPSNVSNPNQAVTLEDPKALWRMLLAREYDDVVLVSSLDELIAKADVIAIGTPVKIEATQFDEPMASMYMASPILTLRVTQPIKGASAGDNFEVATFMPPARSKARLDELLAKRVKSLDTNQRVLFFLSAPTPPRKYYYWTDPLGVLVDRPGGGVLAALEILPPTDFANPDPRDADSLEALRKTIINSL